MNNERYFTVGSRRVRAQFLTLRAVRITHAPPGQAFPADRPWLRHVLLPHAAVTLQDALLAVSLNDGLVQITALDHVSPHSASPLASLALRSRCCGRICELRGPWRFTFHESTPPRFGAQAKQRLPSVILDMSATEVRLADDRAADAVSLALRIEPGEGFYGWGEWFNTFRRERGAIRLKIRDAIAPLQDRETYSALPVFFSSRGYGFWLLNSHPSRWEIDPGRGVMEIHAAGPGADYIVFYGPGFRDLLQTYTELTGRPPLVPRWALGLMVTGYPQEHQSTVLERAHEHRRRNLPLDAIILDYHWEERFHNFQWRPSLIPNPQLLITGLQQLGIRLGLIVTPFLNKRHRPFQRLLLNRLAHNIPRGLEKDDERALPEYEEGRARGYFAHPDAKWWFGAGGMVDFTNPDAAAWFNGLMRPRYAEGVAFFKNDDGEFLPAGARSALGMRGRECHNLYGFFYSRALYQGMEALDDRRGFVYARSAWVGSQRFPAMFLGDQKPTFEHIRSTLRAGLNLSLLGFAHWTVDVFGLDGKTTPETHRRYAQWALLAPIARYFWRPPELDDTRFPWSHGAENEANFRTYTELRYRLLPYYYALAWEAHRTGLPPLRPMLLEFDDVTSFSRFADVADQVMLGDGLLVAPVVEAGATTRRIKLPPGLWHDFWATQTYEGGEIDYHAPADRLPLLARGGTLLPLGPVLQHIPDDHRFDQIELHCYPPYPAEFTLYDDDGLTRAYQRGEFATTRMTAEGDERQVIVRIGADQGHFAGQPRSRQIDVVLHRASPPIEVRLNGQPWAEWRYQAEQQCVRITVVCPTNQETQIDVILTD